jgi:hypothetical protein
MRFPGFSFTGNTLPAILSRAAGFNQYVERVTAENFVKIGVSGEGGPRFMPGILDSIEAAGALLEGGAGAGGKSGSVKIISGRADADLSINLPLTGIPARARCTER